MLCGGGVEWGEVFCSLDLRLSTRKFLCDYHLPWRQFSQHHSGLTQVLDFQTVETRSTKCSNPPKLSLTPKLPKTVDMVNISVASSDLKFGQKTILVKNID